MSYVLIVATLKSCDPMLFRVLVKSNYRLLHSVLRCLTFEVTCTRQWAALDQRGIMSIARIAGPVWTAVARQVHRMVRLACYGLHTDSSHRRPKHATNFVLWAWDFRALGH
jgi:hypothetical protein